MKVSALVAVPAPVVTETVPVVPEPITAIKTVPVFEVIELTAVPPIVTLAAVAPVRFVPFIVIELPAQPLIVLRLVIVGGAKATTFTK